MHCTPSHDVSCPRFFNRFGPTGTKAAHRHPSSRGSMKRTLPPESLQDIAAQLAQAHKAFESRYPGATGARQPVHTVYGGAHLFRANTARRLGEAALRSLDEFAPDFASFAKAISLPGADRLTDSSGAVAQLAKSIEADPHAARKENPPAWFG